ncbi:MAG: hypothetical protein IT262_05710 [Saprospiraceae bacterium]|nr:hypothetical protein [Saprospiraceae bacterium]
MNYSLIMKPFHTVLLLLSALFITTNCAAQPPLKEVRLDARHIVFLLDSAAAAQAITYDKRDGYFEKVTLAEMSIQMKRALSPTDTREKVLPEYIAYLKSDVLDYSHAESKFTAEVIEKVFKTSESVAPGAFPDTLLLIKTKGRHYGDGVWYTRENCIIIPANELASKKTNPFTTTMFHELFHVYSRLQPKKSAQLYKLIGFESIGYENLRIPQQLSDRILHNPDGVDFAQKIILKQTDGSVKQAIPVIYANQPGFKAGNTEFFGYVEFNVYEVEQNTDGTWRVLTKEDGLTSTLSLQSQPDFFAQIKDNTGYIIHPDEVLADNFSFVMTRQKSPALTEKFSPAGKQLLADIEKVLKEK